MLHSPYHQYMHLSKNEQTTNYTFNINTIKSIRINKVLSNAQLIEDFKAL